MFEVMLIIIGAVVGVIIGAMWPKAGKWGDKQGASISKRWDDLREDYNQFSVEARNEFEAIEVEAREKIQQLKARYQRK